MSTNTESDNSDAQPEPTAETSPDVPQDPEQEPNQEPEAEATAEAEAEAVPEPEIESEEAVEPEVEPDVNDSDDGEADTEVQDEPEPEVEDVGDGEDAEDESEPESEGEEGAESDGDEDDDAEVEEEAEEGISGPPSQFQAAIKGGEIKDFVSTLRAIVDEAKITITPDGLATRAVDPANVAMYDIELSTAAFESYDATEGILGVNLERLEEVLKLANKGDLVQLVFDTKTFKLGIHVDGVEFTMACIDPDSIRAEPDIPDMDLPASVTAESDDLSRGVKAADMVSDHIRLHLNEDARTFNIVAEGDTDDVTFELKESDVSEMVVAEANALFSLDYMKDLVKEIPKGEEATLTFGSDFPVMMDYEFADGDGTVLSMLAPRIQSD